MLPCEHSGWISETIRDCTRIKITSPVKADDNVVLPFVAVLPEQRRQGAGLTLYIVAYEAMKVSHFWEAPEKEDRSQASHNVEKPTGCMLTSAPESLA